jgi:putative ABC transport system permease protein
MAGGFRRLLVPRFGYGVGDVLVVLQVGLAVVLVVFSAMVIRFFAEMQRVLRPAVDTSVQVAHLVTPAGLTAAVRADMYSRVLDEIARRGDVKAVAIATNFPGGEAQASIEAASAGGSKECRMSVATVTPGYFEALGLRLERGAIPQKSRGSAIVINKHAAQSCWSLATSEDWRARLAASPPSEWMPVSGVVADPFRRASALGIRTEEKLGERTVAWIIGAREWPPSAYLIVKPQADAPVPPASLASAVARASSSVAMGPVTTLEETYNTRFAGLTTGLTVIGAVTALALLLAFTGVYAALSQSCTLRLTELGIRLALGADPGRLAAVAIGRDLPLVAIGVVGGLVGTLWVTSITWRDLLLIAALDARVWAAVAAVLGAAALLASIGPVLRAVRVDPIEVLRAD